MYWKTVVDFPAAHIVQMICVLVIWLHNRAGVSRSVTNRILHGIQLIISATLCLVEAALASSGFTVKLGSIKLPHDIRTAYRLHCSEPVIIRTACCPQCFSLYSTPIPSRCPWKASPRSRPCNTELWMTRNTPKGPKRIPQRLYTTQCFDSWLQFFLSCQVIEDALCESFHARQNHQPAVFGAIMKDIQDSPAWQDLLGFSQSPYHLCFGIYVDWFNPFTNKIAGKIFINCG